MSDAQSVVLQGNMRRAVLEMAIACEIAAMQALFSPSTQFGAAYGHLAGKGKVNVKVIDFICHRLSPPLLREPFSVHMRVKCLT